MRASIVIASWQRPRALRRCLTAISQLQGVTFEVVVVADETGLCAARTLPFHANLKLHTAPEPNIAVARNIGIADAAGDVVAFIDDDAVPEPSWLKNLISPFLEPEIHAAGGFVRARNGISWQWKGRCVNALGHTRALNPGSTAPEGWASKTEGTNMAVRRDVLMSLGGFDPAYAYFLDETDLNLRLAQNGLNTVIVPGAEVHHGYEAGRNRRPDRVPRDLFDHGHSWAVFLRKFAQSGDIQPRLSDIRAEFRRLLLTHMVAGRLEPRDIPRLLGRLDAGIVTGLDRKMPQATSLSPTGTRFLAFPAEARQSKMLFCRPLTAGKTRDNARHLSDTGHIVTVMNFSATALFHHVRFREEGYWEHTGGIFGKSERNQPLVQLGARRIRYNQETKRVRDVRLIGAIVC